MEDCEGTKGRVLPPLSLRRERPVLGRVDVNKIINTKKVDEVLFEILQDAERRGDGTGREGSREKEGVGLMQVNEGEGGKWGNLEKRRGTGVGRRAAKE